MSTNSTVQQMDGDHRAFSRFGFLSIAVALSALGGFAAHAPLDSAAIATGRVSTETLTKPIQHLEGGIVRDIMVKEQEAVKEGQVLFRLMPTQARASSEMLKGQIDQALAQEARLDAERQAATSVTYPEALNSRRSNPPTTAAIADQDRQFNERRASLENQKLILQSRVDQAEKEIDGLVHEETTLKDQAVSFNSEIAGVTTLERKGLYPKNRLLALQREESKVKGQLAALQGGMARKREVAGEARLQLKQAVQAYREQASGRLADVRARLADLSEKFKVADDVMSRIEIRAPQDGIVQGIKVHAAGAVVRPGDQIAELVPSGDNLVMATRISPLDIASVMPGQAAEVRFPAFSSRQMPIILGHVKNIGADTMMDEVTRQPYYSALVIVDPKKLPEAVRGKLVPGMPAIVLISTGERTLLQYLVSPVTDLLATSMRER